MPQYRLFLLDRQNHIVDACERECHENDIQLVASDVLKNAASLVDGVEVWYGAHRLNRLRRA